MSTSFFHLLNDILLNRVDYVKTGLHRWVKPIFTFGTMYQSANCVAAILKYMETS